MPIPDCAEELMRFMLLRGDYPSRRSYMLNHADWSVRGYLESHRNVRCAQPAPSGQLDAEKAQIEAAMNWLEHPRHHLVSCRDPAYSPLLKQTGCGPLAVFVDGDPLKTWRPSIAVIGSRNPTQTGKDNTRDFVGHLVGRGLGIVSGLAHGIDSVAHRAALDCGGLTMAVIGTGPDRYYPPAHRPLQEEIAENGAVLTELLPRTEPRRGNFPTRNRIIAGMTVATLVMESAEGSGTMITAEASIRMNRDVFTIPGSIHNPLYRGNNALLREGSATVVQSADDVIDDLKFILQRSWMDVITIPPETRALFAQRGYMPPLEIAPEDPDYYTLWEALDETPRDMGELADRTGLTYAKVSVMLMELELKKQVSSRNGRYRQAALPTAH